MVRGTDGRVDGVRYEELASMLLKQAQQLQLLVRQQQQRLAAQEVELAAQADDVRDLKRQFADMSTIYRRERR